MKKKKKKKTYPCYLHSTEYVFFYSVLLLLIKYRGHGTLPDRYLFLSSFSLPFFLLSLLEAKGLNVCT